MTNRLPKAAGIYRVAGRRQILLSEPGPTEVKPPAEAQTGDPVTMLRQMQLRFSLQLANQKVLTDRLNIQLKELDGRLASLLTERDELRAELVPAAAED